MKLVSIKNSLMSLLVFVMSAVIVTFLSAEFKNNETILALLDLIYAGVSIVTLLYGVIFLPVSIIVWAFNDSKE